MSDEQANGCCGCFIVWLIALLAMFIISMLIALLHAT
jgi:hypothetical protein